MPDRDLGDQMARKHGVDAAVGGPMVALERQKSLEMEFGRSVADHAGIIHDKGLYGYGELMLAFGMSREAARQLLQAVGSHPGSRGRMRFTQHEYFVFGLDLRLYLESTCVPAEVKAPKSEGETDATEAENHGRPNRGRTTH